GGNSAAARPTRPSTKAMTMKTPKDPRERSNQEWLVITPPFGTHQPMRLRPPGIEPMCPSQLRKPEAFRDRIARHGAQFCRENGESGVLDAAGFPRGGGPVVVTWQP